jgi:hypothetical protein
VSRCGAVYVELGERPELDRLESCSREPVWRSNRTGGGKSATWCAEHLAQLAWLLDDGGRFDAYIGQQERYGQQQSLVVRQESLL